MNTLHRCRGDQHAHRVLLVATALLLSACAARPEPIVSLMKDTQNALNQCQEDRAQLKAQLELQSKQRSSLLSERSPQKMDRTDLVERCVTDSSQSRPQRQVPLEHMQTSEEVTLSAIVTAAESLQIEVKTLKIGHLLTFGPVRVHMTWEPTDKILAMTAHFKGYSLGLDFVNEWNRTKRFGRVYLEENGDLVIETDANMTEGRSIKALRLFLQDYGMLVNFFKVNLDQAEHRKKDRRGPSIRL